MNSVVLDASALLALLLGEPGADRVKAALDGSVMSTVNLGEVVSHYAKLGAGRQDIKALLRSLPIRLVPLDAALSYDAGMLRLITLEGGLALAAYRRGGGGDRRTDPVRARRTARGGACHKIRRETVPLREP